MGQRKNGMNVVMMDAPIMPRKEECVIVMGQRDPAVMQDVTTKPGRKEESV